MALHPNGLICPKNKNGMISRRLIPDIDINVLTKNGMTYSMLHTVIKQK